MFHSKKGPSTPSSSDSEDSNRRNQLSDTHRAPRSKLPAGTNSKFESPVKVDPEGKSVQDKKKSDTLRKLFTPKRDTEGGKGGGGKGGKGGKGKGGVNVIILDGDHERSSSSLEDEVAPAVSSNPVVLSQIPVHEVHVFFLQKF